MLLKVSKSSSVMRFTLSLKLQRWLQNEAVLTIFEKAEVEGKESLRGNSFLSGV